MTPYKAIMTLRSMSQDGVNHVGEIADVIESMQNRLDAYEQGVQADIARSMIKTADQLNARVAELERELAAAQAREKVLRDALKVQPRNLRNVWKDGIDIDLPDRVTERRDEALAMQTDDTALKAALVAERELCAAEVYDDGKRNPIESARERIRALGDK